MSPTTTRSVRSVAPSRTRLGRRALAAALLALALAPVTHEARGAPLPPLPLLPSVPRVKITTHGSAIAIVQEVNLPRGDWKGQPLRFHVAFGAPGPRAIDAHLVPVADGSLEPDDTELGEAVVTDRVPRRSDPTYPLLGRETMAGVAIALRPDQLTRAFARGNMAALRVRSLVDAPEVDPTGATSIVVRLGVSRGTPLTLGRIVADAAPRTPALSKVEARLCGPDADPHPLAVGTPPFARPAGDTTAIAPVLAVRHPTDDLCVRLWRANAK